MPVLTAQLAQAYLKASYWIFLPHAVLLFKPRKDSPALRDLHTKHHTDRSALISAANPFSVPVSDEENKKAMRHLEQDIGNKWVCYRAEGADTNSGKKAEPSFLIMGISLADALGLGRTHDQFAIVYIEDNKLETVPRLVACHLENQAILDSARTHAINY